MPFDETALTCARVRERVDDFVDSDAEDGLTPEEHAAVARHSAGCDACRAEIATAAAVLSELRAFPIYDAPDSVIEAAQAAIGAADRVTALPRRAPARTGLLRWIPATVATAALIALVASARWSGPVATSSSGFSQARVERASREAMLALSYVNHYARMAGEIVAVDVLEKRVVGTMERAIDREIIDQGLVPPFRRALKKSRFVETKSSPERS